MIEETKSDVVTLLFNVDRDTDLDQFLADELRKCEELYGPIQLIEKLEGLNGDDFVNNKITLRVKILKLTHA